MTVPSTVDAAGWLRNHLEGPDGDVDLARAMVQAFAEALMSAEASMQCQAAYGERTEERVNSRNGYRDRRWDTRVGTEPPRDSWMLQPLRRMESCQPVERPTRPS